MTNTVQQNLIAKRDRLQEQLARVEVQIKQQEFVDQIVPGVLVNVQTGAGLEFTGAKVLSVSKGEGTSGTWYKLLVNENTPDVDVKSVRLSDIVEVVAAPAGEVAAE